MDHLLKKTVVAVVLVGGLYRLPAPELQRTAVRAASSASEWPVVVVPPTASSITGLERGSTSAVGAEFGLKGSLAKTESAADTAVDPAWQSKVEADIVASEYAINFQKSVHAYQSPNRAQDLRIIYYADGFHMQPRVRDDGHSIDLRVQRVGKQGDRFLPLPDAPIIVSGNTMQVDHDAFVVDYVNDKRGMRQNFTVRKKPVGTGPLEVTMKCSGGPLPIASGNDILFRKADSLGRSAPWFWYKGLRAWDALGDTLCATATVDNGSVVLAVNDDEAIYPITIDPLSTTADWTGESNQANANFGQCVRTAGDLNGDGYSDVIIGAPFYDNGQTNEGRMFVYNGSITGLPASASYTREHNVSEVGFSYAISTAGDVNNDGYSDVAVTEEGTSMDHGNVFIFHGSASGLSAIADLIIPLPAGLVHWTLACAGDVNHDGYSDLLVSGSDYNAYNGVVYVFHGSATGIHTPAARTLNGTGGNNFGYSVSGAGDVNGDGISDIIVSEPFWTHGQTWEGRVLVYYGVSGTGIGPTAAWSYESNVPNSEFGNSVSFAGDVNADGYSDIIAGSVIYANGQVMEGRAYLFLGSSTGLPATPSWTYESNLANATFGASVSGAGDVNGDGYADVLISATYANNAAVGGRAYVFYGSSTGLPATASWTGTTGQANDGYGNSVSTAGDVNGDGYSDIIVGAPRYDNGQTDEGRAFVYYGSPTGLGTTASTRNGSQDSGFFGTSVSTAGDVNGDGYSDVIIGAPLFDNGQTDEGRAYVYLGSATGMAATAAWTAESDQADANFGTSVSTAGDVNGDGYSDVIVGAPSYDNGQTDEGRAFIYHGSATGLAAAAAATRESDQANAYFGSSVSCAGDVNGDGYSDVIVGAPNYDNGQTDEGRAFVYLGSSTGIAATAVWTAENDKASSGFGSSVASAGDVNGDGYGDVIVGAPFYTNGQADEGGAYIYSGMPTGVSATPMWITEGQKINAFYGTSVACAGDVNGNGYSDVIVGAPGYTNGQTGEGRAFVFTSNAGGISLSWVDEGAVAGANFGASVSKAGDVNGDGYGDVIIGAPGLANGSVMVYEGSPTGLKLSPSLIVAGAQTGELFGSSVSSSGSQSGSGFGDVIVGAPAWNLTFAQVDRGRVYEYLGNSGTTLSQPTKQYRSNLTTPVQTSNGTMAGSCDWGIGQVVCSWTGRHNVKLVWQVIGHGPAYGVAPIADNTIFTGQSAAWTDLSVPGTEIKQVLTTAGASFPKWRVRVRNHPATMIDGQVFGRWFYGGINDKQEAGIKVDPGSCGPLPIELIAFNANCTEGRAQLTWTTASESNNANFTIARSTDAEVWSEVARVNGAGNSEQQLDYSFTDPTPLPDRVSYYRLSQTDIDGTVKVFPSIPLGRCSGTSNGQLQVFPNPSSGATELVLTASGADGPATIECVDVQGRVVLIWPVILDPELTRTNGDLSGLAPGVYAMRVVRGGAIIGAPVRLIKQ